METKDFSNLTIADIGDLIKDNERLKRENEALKKSPSGCDKDYIVYMKKDGTGFINGSPSEITEAVHALIKDLSKQARLPFWLITEAILTVEKVFGKEE